MEQTHTEVSEKAKYHKAWSLNDYRRFSPAEQERAAVLEWLKKHECKDIVDFGCGTGRLDLFLKNHGYSVRMLDIAENCLDEKVRNSLDNDLTFENRCLWDDSVNDIKADSVICIDVLEHIPPQYVEMVCRHIRTAAPHGYVNAALYKDAFGKRVGSPLHLTVKPAAYWHGMFPDATHIVRGNDAWMIW